MSIREDWRKRIEQRAPAYGVDPRAALAVALTEGLSGAVGDGGHAFGPFQLNDAGGVLTGRPGDHRAFAESNAGIDWALQRIASSGAAGKTGAPAINAIVHNFERPANPGAEVARALANYGQTPATMTPSRATVPVAPPTQTAAAPATDVRRQLALELLKQSQSATPNYSPLLRLAQSARMPQVAPAAPAAPRPALTPMTTAGPVPTAPPANPGKWLHVSGDSTLEGVNPTLVSAVAALAASIGKPITVTSGHRDRDEQAGLYQRYVNSGFNRAYIAAKPGLSNHERGQALDLTIDGVPIENAVPADVLRRYGLWNSVPGDRPHTVLLGTRG